MDARPSEGRRVPFPGGTGDAHKEDAAAIRYTSRSLVEPGDALLLNNLAWVAGQVNDPKALEYAERADKLAQDNPGILDTLGVLLVDKGDAKRGIDLLRAGELARGCRRFASISRAPS